MMSRLNYKMLLLVLSVFVVLQGWAQTTVVSGKVVNKSTNEAVDGATVQMGSVAVVTNADGFFTLKSDATASTVKVSHIGYRAQTVRLDGEPSSFLTIKLAETAIPLEEVLVLARDPRELVMTAISKIDVNYSRHPELYRCFYRESIMKRQHYISVAEGVTDMYKTSYQRGTLRDRVAIRKGRRLMSTRRSDTLGVKVLGGPVAPIELDLVKNTSFLLNEEELNLYDMKMEMPVMLGDRRQLVVSLMPRVNAPYALYFGKLYIDSETLAFTRAELSLDMSDRMKATQAMLVKKPAGVRFRPKELSCLVDYRLGNDGITRISYIRTAFRFNCDWKRRLFATSFAAFCEMAVTSIDRDNVQPIQGRESFDQRDAFFDKVDYFRDPTFWQDYNIIEPTESLDKAIHRIIRRIQ